MDQKLLDIKNLSVAVHSDSQKTNILNAVNLAIAPNTICALVGGSGSGKTTLGLSILRLLGPGLVIDQGQILFEGRDLVGLSEKQMYSVRGKSVGMVFQEPLSAFNPILKIGYQIEEVLSAYTSLKPHERRSRIYELLSTVGVDEPKRITESYPHQLSGGLRQRAMIAQAIAVSPKLIIADEPTSNLDVTLQAKVLELFVQLKHKLNLSILLITHDLGLVQHVCDDLAVIHEGAIVETGKATEVLNSPKHPYTQQLLTANTF